MMTEQRKRRLRAKIRASRGRLMETQPFFALLLMYIRFVAVRDMKKISTNGRCIYFSPDFIDKLYNYELDYILCHQMMHIILGHIWRPYDREGDDFHFACDIRLNALLVDCGFTEEHYAHLDCVYRSIPGTDENPVGITPDEIYKRLPYSLYAFDERTRNKFLMDSDLWWDQKDDMGDSGEVILDRPDLDSMQRAKRGTVSGFLGGDGELQQVWKDRVASAASAASLKRNDADFGCVPDFVKRMIEKMKEPTINWKRVLDHFIQERICDYSFAPPDRRFSDSDFFLPDFNEKEFISKEVLFMVDTSGSVGDEDLAAVYSELCGAIEQFGGKITGKLGFFDVCVTSPLPFENVSDIMSIFPYGGGGTDFAVIFDYIRNCYKDELPACVVIFTDGDGPYPPQAEAMGIPVLWVIDNNDFTPPWGKVTRMISASPE